MRVREKKNKKWMVILAAALIICGLEGNSISAMNAMASQVGIQGESIEIHTAEEFAEFGRNCTSESFSKGKRFSLEADINLLEADFQPIAVFAGVFEGNGHTITGLSIHSSGSNLGLFRYVEEGAAIRNLKVHGTISPEGSRTNIGGIAGTNRGTIENCEFAGEVTAQEALGGIAGYNESTGVIRECVNEGTLTGNLKTGGITGLNEGLVQGCVNRGGINATDQSVEVASGDSISAGGISLEESIRVERVNDAGGIAGLSLGTIRDCENHGAVGYPHTGYNLGGIAGRQSGLIEQCLNYGKIQGRKDVGGITGQFEPYLTVSYDEDTLGQLEDQLDVLSRMGDDLSRLIEQAGDHTSGSLDQVDARMGNVKDIGEFYKDIYRDDGNRFNRSMDRSAEEIQDILDRMDFDLTSRGTEKKLKDARKNIRLIQELKKTLETGYGGDIKDTENLKQWLEQRFQNLKQLFEYSEQLKEDIDYLVVHLPEDAVRGVGDFADDLDDLQMEASEMLDVVRINRDRVKTDLESMDEELTTELDLLSGDVDTLTDHLKTSKDQIRDQKNQIEDQIDRMRNTISDGIDRTKVEKKLFEDVSDAEQGELSEGMVYGSINQGAVSSDYQSGGIIGIIGVEISADPEQDLETDDEKTLNMVRNAKAIVLNCKNQGEIYVKNDYVGGIVGKANMGALIQNQNYGDVMAETGSYVGGIAGNSSSVLRQNYSMCSVAGKDYLGGIAGWGTDIRENYAMASFNSQEGEWIGSIAGNVDEEGTVEGNVYVDEGIGAVDGITYEAQAQGLPYETFRNLEQVPEEFGRLIVTFLVEDQVVGTISCQYGSGVKAEDIPLVPQKDGYYYEWEEKDLSCITGNEKVHAVYRAWNTTIASSEDKKPLMLVEANFYPGTQLEVEETAEAELAAEVVYGPEGDAAEGYRAAAGYAYSIKQPEGVAMPEIFTVHVLAEGYPKESRVAVMKNGRMELTESRWDGDYLIFQMEEPGEVVILKPGPGPLVWTALALVILIFGAFIIWEIRRKKGMRDNGSEKPIMEEAGPEENVITSIGDDEMKHILVSACLCGENCKWDGGNNKNEKVLDYMKKMEGKAVFHLVCPEQMGGLSTPRPASEIRVEDHRVVNTEGRDVTGEFEHGAELALQVANESGCTLAILKERSPSCGCHGVYDGTFSKKIVDGMGKTAELLTEHGIRVIGESEIGRDEEESFS